ncbi:DUF559 domain-containing protein [Sinomonas sp. ASV322]|uniref:DUF559 domain-containing protein n=1 Tax=Sinomonas sp. ASV322 TaxID=3041920 RepID=UPI0027DD848C|nr:DUF559 domain-containing protein [Sinomonas sp. ASV322]MDQ4503103.1 DUF559 domain-containing protein [Sinomonas sp. ASV322]
MDPLQILGSLGGVARTATLIEAGLSRTDLDYVARRAARPKRGVYALDGCRRDFLSAIMHNAVITCASAARDYGLWLRKPPHQDHLGCDHGHGASRGTGGIRPVVHRGLRYPAHHSLPLAALEDVLLHALRCLPAQAAVPLAASAIRLHGLRIAFLEEELTAQKSGRSLATLRAVEPRVESLPEAEALLLLIPLAKELGLDVEPQALIPGIGRVDFLIGGFLIVEIDGVAYHSDRDSVRRDRRRDNSATLRGYLRLRYLPEEIWNEPDRFIAEVRAALTGRAL